MEVASPATGTGCATFLIPYCRAEQRRTAEHAAKQSEIISGTEIINEVNVLHTEHTEYSLCESKGSVQRVRTLFSSLIQLRLKGDASSEDDLEKVPVPLFHHFLV